MRVTRAARMTRRQAGSRQRQPRGGGRAVRWKHPAPRQPYDGKQSKLEACRLGAPTVVKASSTPAVACACVTTCTSCFCCPAAMAEATALAEAAAPGGGRAQGGANGGEASRCNREAVSCGMLCRSFRNIAAMKAGIPALLACSADSGAERRGRGRRNGLGDSAAAAAASASR